MTEEEKCRKRKKRVPATGEDAGADCTSKRLAKNSDGYCWRCHKEGVLVCCDLCPRSYHLRCLGLSRVDDDNWVCVECVQILKAENADTQSPAMQMLSVDQFVSLLKFALGRMKIQCPEEFLRPVSLTEFPNYSHYVVHPLDMSTLENNIKRKMYGSTESFLADAKWILHNCVIYNGFQHKLTSVARSIVKICEQEMAEIEVCPDCYHNAHTKRENWFQETCSIPHLLIWAKLKGFPFWPGKAMRIVSNMVDVRFFGAHDRAWIPIAHCFLLSKNIPTPQKSKKRVFEQSMEELERHVQKLRQKFGTFDYAPFKTTFDAQDVITHLQKMLPEFENTVVLERFLIDRTRTTVDVTFGENFESCGVQGYDVASDDVKKRDTNLDEEIHPHKMSRKSESTTENIRKQDVDNLNLWLSEFPQVSDDMPINTGTTVSIEEKLDNKSGQDLLSLANAVSCVADNVEDDEFAQNTNCEKNVCEEISHSTCHKKDLDKNIAEGVQHSNEDNPLVQKLKLAIHQLKWAHQHELLEMEHNYDLILLEMYNSMLTEKKLAIAAVEKQCELEKVKAIQETKKKQWCVVCGKEAALYCCWNTSYCDYPCQQSHWPQHMNGCTQAAKMHA